jgi:membrane fusion protein
MMTDALFRQEAIDHQRLRIWGEVTLALPMSYALVTGFIAASVLTATVFIGTETYARKEHATGFLAPRTGIARITPSRPGTVIAVAVHEGQRVGRGATLLTVSDAETSERGENVDAAKAAELEVQCDRLRDQIGFEHAKSQLEGRQLQSQITTAEHELGELRRQETIQAERIEIARRQLGGALELAAKGYLSQVELRRRQDAYLAERQNDSGLANERLAKEAQLSELNDKLRQQPLTTADKIARTEAEIAEIEARLKDIDRQRGYQLRAPIAGRISALQAWVGKSVDSRLPVLSIVPEGDILEAHLLVPARAIAFVARGQPVHISYDTFPFQQFGFAGGIVRSVSQTLLKPDEIVGPVLVREPSYRVEVALDRQTIRAYSAELPLEPDLQLQADIVAERRSLVSWLLDPLLSVWRRS